MKLRFLLLLAVILTVIQPSLSYAYTIMYNKYFIGSLDQYRMDFSYPTGTATYGVHFIGTSGTPYDLSYSQVPTGIFYLTCNGTYAMYFYDNTGIKIGYFENIVTTAIVNPSCSSYSGQTGNNDMSAKYSGTGPNYDLSWDPRFNGTTSYVYKDGNLVYQGSGNTYSGTKGSYTILEVSNGSVVSQSDVNVPATNVSGGTAGSGQTEAPPCDVCDQIRQMLSCPGWGEVMGDVTQAVKNALPTLPEWRSIADQFVDAFSDYFGQVPTQPSKEQIADNITPQLPSIDTTTPQVAPAVPSAFNDGPLPFDVTSGPQIPVIDESQPIEIYEPNKYIKSDTAGQMVFPKDSRNSSDGIKQPNTFTSPYTTPVPTKTNDSTIPPADIPKPKSTAPNGSTPNPTPTPATSGGVIPIPKKN